MIWVQLTIVRFTGVPAGRQKATNSIASLSQRNLGPHLRPEFRFAPNNDRMADIRKRSKRAGKRLMHRSKAPAHSLWKRTFGDASDHVRELFDDVVSSDKDV